MDKQHGGVDIDKVYYLNNCINLNEFEQNVRTFQSEDPDLDNPNTYKIVYTGSVRLANNIRKLVDAAAIIQEKGANNIRFIVNGDGNERAELEKYCKDH